jgi:excinuclease ABC subunit C
MAVAAQSMNFEKAAELRDQLRALEKLAQQQSVNFIPGFSADVIDFAWSSSAVSVYFAIVRDGKLIGGNSHVIREGLERVVEFAVDGSDENFSADTVAKREFILQVVGQFYATHEIPARVYLPSAANIFSDGASKALHSLLASIEDDRSKRQERTKTEIQLFLSSRSDAAKVLKGAQKKLFTEAFEGLCEMVRENAKTKLQDTLNADDVAHRRMSAVQTLLSLPGLPHWIECYDISTFQGGSTVASGVVFRNGQPAKNEYRKYTIREVAGQDDFASLREVMRRRFREERRHEIPDLLLIDGGEPQVREVGWILRSLGLDSVPLFGIAKSRTVRNFREKAVAASAERIVCPMRKPTGELIPDGGTETKILRNASPEFQLVTQIRNEAHRFAISFHRKKRDGRSLRSLLSEINGLGPKRRKKLLLEFGSVDKISQASLAELIEKAGLPSAVAQNVLDFFEAKRRDRTPD